MASQEWIFASYLASLAQNDDAQSKTQNVHEDQCTERDEERVFTELKPALIRKSEMGEERMLRFLDMYTSQDPDGQPNLESHTIPNEQATENFRSDENRERVIEQPLLFWDLNRLAAFGNDAVITDDEDTKEIENDLVNKASDTEELQSIAGYNNQNEVIEEDFKFPQCIEDQFRAMMLRANKREWQCKNCGSNAVQDRQHQPLGQTDQEAVKHLQACDEEILFYKRQFASESNLRPGKRSSCLTKQAMPNATYMNTNVQKKDVVNIDDVITRINPELDVLSKTFHKIPSTQPIYCDNEAQEDDSGREHRIKRPMNAFMLWARKYRSLVAKEFSEASNSEISVKLGEIWNELTSDQQRPYFKRAESLKAQHKQNHPNYVYQPRLPSAKSSTKKDKNSSKGSKGETIAFGTLPADFGTPFAFFSATKPYGTQQLKKLTNDVPVVKTEMIKSQSGPVIMAPKPVYPAGFNDRNLHGIKQEIDASSKVLEHCNEDESIEVQGNKTQLLKNEITPKLEEENHDMGLVKDAMLPRPERTGDDCDLMSSGLQAFNITALDDFLASGSKDLSDYFDSSMLRSGREDSRKMKRNAVKRKRTIAKANAYKRAKTRGRQ